MLTIVIPALNEEEYLPLLLGSIRKQNFKDCEVIVADAGSQDKTVEIAKNFGCRVVKGGLLARGRNEGAKVARGDLLLFLDADIMIPENSLGGILREFKERKLGVATFTVQPFGKKRTLRFFYDFFYNWPLLFAEKLTLNAGGPILVKKELHERIGGFDEEIEILEDTEYVRRALKIGKFGMLKSTKIFYSERRLEKEGRAKVYLKYLLAYFYLLFFGPIKTDIFKYKYEQYKHHNKK